MSASIEGNRHEPVPWPVEVYPSISSLLSGVSDETSAPISRPIMVAVAPETVSLNAGVMPGIQPQMVGGRYVQVDNWGAVYRPEK